ARLGARERVILSAVGAKDLLVTRRGRRAVSLGVPGGAMRQTSQREQAETFRRLHREGGILVLPNAWDVITARVIESAGLAGVPLVINARTDAFEVKEWSPSDRLTAAVRRANAYRAAGADCLFVPHVSDAATIERLAREIEGPLNVIAGPPAPTIPELERLG